MNEQYDLIALRLTLCSRLVKLSWQYYTPMQVGDAAKADAESIKPEALTMAAVVEMMMSMKRKGYA